MGLAADSVVFPSVQVDPGQNAGVRLANIKGASPNVTAGPAPETAAAPINSGSANSDDAKTAGQDKGDKEQEH